MIQVLRIIQLVPDAFEHIGMMGGPSWLLLPMLQGLTRGTLWTWISSIWHKNIRWNWDAVTFNKNTFRYFSVLCTLRMSEHSGHYCIVMYKCNINVVMTTLVYLQALPWHAGISEAPGDALSITGSKPSAHSPAVPSPGRSLEEAVCSGLQRRSRWIQLFLHCWSRIKLHLLLSSFLKLNIIL